MFCGSDHENRSADDYHLSCRTFTPRFNIDSDRGQDETMTTEPNPYSSPEVSHETSFSSDTMIGLPHGLPGRLGVGLLGGVFGIVALFSLGTFVFQLQYILPTGESFVRAQPMWVFAHLIRGVGLSIVSWQLFRYCAVIGKISTRDDLLIVAQRHGALWNWSEIVILSIVAYSTGTVIAMMGSILL